MKQQYPFWFTLIKAWLDKKHNGLTLPFLVGARALFLGNATANRNEAEAIINEMVSNPIEGYTIYIRWCNDIQDAVFALYKNEYQIYNLGIEINPINIDNPPVIIEKNLAVELGLNKSPENIIKAIIDKSEKHILTGNYSKTFGEDGLVYCPFNDDSINFIKEALSK